MSTKIYNAFRIKPGLDMWAVTEDIREEAEARVRSRLAAVYRGWLSDRTAVTEIKRELGIGVKSGDHVVSFSDASRYMRDMYAKQAGRYDRNEFDLDVNIAVHRVGRNTLLRAFSGSGYLNGVLAFLAKRPDLEDYHYQNAADRPAEVPARVWAARRDVWRRAMREDGQFTHQLEFSIVSVDGFLRVDPWVELARRAFAKDMRRRRKGARL